jgi:Protein of unknown function (DUF1559)
MSFRLTSILWVFAVAAAAMATFGSVGAFAAAIVVGFWATWYCRQKFPSLLTILFVVGIILILVVLLIPAVNSARPTRRREMCENQLHSLAKAVLLYDQSQNMLPPAYSVDPKGEPALSWRALILRAIEREDLFSQFDLAKKWDDFANTKSSSVDIDLFHCPANPNLTTDGTTDYFAVVGPHTAWPGIHPRKLSEIKDNPARTIVLVEAIDRDAKWAEPRDLSFDEAVDLLSSPSEHAATHLYFGRNEDFFYKDTRVGVRGMNVAMADGRVWFILLPIPKTLAIGLLTADGGEDIDEDLFHQFVAPQIDYGRCYALATFVALAILPALRPWYGRVCLKREHTYKKTVDESGSGGV